MKEEMTKPVESNLIIYSTPDGHVKVDIVYSDESFWMTQKRMAELFGVEVNTINYHLKEIFKSGELSEDPVIRKIRIAAADNKPYLTNIYNLDEINDLNRIVSMYLDYAENQASRQIPMSMKDWVSKLDAFLQFNEYQVLKDAGRISADIAKNLAEEQYEKFRVVQDKLYESDFDKEVKKITTRKPKEK